MKTRFLWGMLILVVLAVALALWRCQSSSGPCIASSAQGASEASDANDADSQAVRLDEAVQKEFAIKTAPAGPGTLSLHITLAGTIAFNSDRLAHITPRVSGVVREVRKNLGDLVRAGDVLAVIESRDLTDAKAAYLAAGERLILAQANFTREESLWQKKITAEKEYLESKQALAEARIALRSAQQKLHALGFSSEDLNALPSQPEPSFGRYEITAPLDGTVVEKHLVLGEVVREDSDPFLIADLSGVWVDLKVHQQDIARIRPGQTVLISASPDLETQGTISFVSPTMSEPSRTALARVVIPNTAGRWRPGLYVTGRVAVEELAVSLIAPKDALVRLDGHTCVFVQRDQAFVPQPVTVGQSNDKHVEITAGLTPGQIYVTHGAFTLKAELNKPSEEEGHGH